jgi:acyl carrier protein
MTDPHRNDVALRVINIIGEQLDESNFVASAALMDDLGSDSLGIVEIAVALEEAFEMEIPDEAINDVNFATVQDTIDYVEGRLQEKGC